MIRDAEDKLQRGYKKLISYEASTGGFEWFGESPGHEALSAYGLMQFIDMTDVMNDVSLEMIGRV